MIGLDTNILVRYITLDDPTQAPLAVKLIDSLTQDLPGFISLVVIIELCWVLEVSYDFDKAAVTKVLDTLLRSKEIVLEQSTAVSEALHHFGSGNADFADYLVECCGRAAGCTKTFTFDRKAAGSGMMLLK